MEEWDFIDDRQLVRSYSSQVCMTCQHFAYGVDGQCHTLLGCNLRQAQIQQGEHITKQCRHWSSVVEMEGKGTVAA